MTSRWLADPGPVDAGTVLPGVTDGFTGRAPDLGALESGRGVPRMVRGRFRSNRNVPVARSVARFTCGMRGGRSVNRSRQPCSVRASCDMFAGPSSGTRIRSCVPMTLPNARTQILAATAFVAAALAAPTSAVEPQQPQKPYSELTPRPMWAEKVKEGLFVVRGPLGPCLPMPCPAVPTPVNPDGLLHEPGDVAVRVTPRGADHRRHQVRVQRPRASGGHQDDLRQADQVRPRQPLPRRPQWRDRRDDQAGGDGGGQREPARRLRPEQRARVPRRK